MLLLLTLKKILTKLEISKLNLSTQQKDILVGLCLGDLYIRKSNKNRNP